MLIYPNSDDVSKWVKRQLSGTIDRLETVRVLPWKIGLSITIKASGTLQLVLQDILRTDSLLLFLASEFCFFNSNSDNNHPHPQVTRYPTGAPWNTKWTRFSPSDFCWLPKTSPLRC